MALKDTWRPVLLKRVEAGYATNVWIQRSFGVTKERPHGRLPVTLFFRLAAALGTEVTFILVLPLVFWIVDTRLGLRMVILWATTYYVGQFVKDYFQLPRPTAPVVQLEAHYAEEYGLPSTHVMGGLTTPFYVWHYFYVRGDADPWTIFIPLVWFISIGLSRLYLGAHSPLDCTAGLVLAVGVMVWWWMFGVGRAVEAWMERSDYVVEATWAVTFLALYVYPRPDYWVSSFGDTAIILGCLAGVVCGTYWAPSTLLDTTPLYGREAIFARATLMRIASRFVIGCGALLVTRVIVKNGLIRLIPCVLPHSDAPPKRRFAVEIPTKVITYAGVGIVACRLAPSLFQYLEV